MAIDTIRNLCGELAILVVTCTDLCSHELATPCCIGAPSNSKSKEANRLAM